MPRDRRYDVLFEPVKIGPKTARNRFYQVPHCNGMGHVHPRALAAMRGVKAEGGWAVISTEEVEIHPQSDFSPYKEGRLWDDHDIPYHRLVTDAIHEPGSLAAIELAFNGMHAPNLFSRLPLMGPSNVISDNLLPAQARAMDKQDILNVRKWHRQAALRARTAGYDIVYVYAGHAITMLHHMLSPDLNQRTDAYGGSLENRVRLLREVIEDTRDAVGHDTAVALRLAVEDHGYPEPISNRSEMEDIVGMLADLPDLFDVNVSRWDKDSATARFQPNEGYQDDAISFVKRLTKKPVVGVGRYTSADGMVSRVKSGLIDFIGAARPSIADPFLPKKIEEGRIEEIRECIGCNICVMGDYLMTPMRCTQNPTVGEEWRRGWHPEKIAAAPKTRKCLVIGAGPAGLECALQLAKRGHEVVLAEASKELGGRVTREARLPGLASYARVRDYRQGLLSAMPNVEIYRESWMKADDVFGFGASAVFVATGARWRTDGVGRTHRRAVAGLEKFNTLGPDQVLDGAMPKGKVVIFDDDNYTLGSVFAEKFIAGGLDVTLVTAQGEAAAFTKNTMEQSAIISRLMQLGVNIESGHLLKGAEPGHLLIESVYTGKVRAIACDTFVPLTARLQNDELFLELQAKGGIEHLELIGDAFAPHLIAAAVWSGHRAARDLDRPAHLIEADIYRRDRIVIDDMGGNEWPRT